jgi:hypothetical protein
VNGSFLVDRGVLTLISLPEMKRHKSLASKAAVTSLAC